MAEKKQDYPATESGRQDDGGVVTLGDVVLDDDVDDDSEGADVSNDPEDD